jgi:hypothetical protein
MGDFTLPIIWALISGSAVLTMLHRTLGISCLKKDPKMNALFNVQGFWFWIRMIGFLFANMIYFGIGPEFIIGNAIEEAPKLGIIFDMAFIDGDKRTYIETFEMVMKILKPGGFILADNTLWDGHVVDDNYKKDQQTSGINSFNDYIMNDNRVEKVILPLRDGLTLIRKKD